MSHEPYAKHGLFTGIYQARGKVFDLPDKASWQVLKYVGHQAPSSGVFSNDMNERGEIALVLNDEENNFWPIISFLTQEEARALSTALLLAARLV